MTLNIKVIHFTNEHQNVAMNDKRDLLLNKNIASNSLEAFCIRIWCTRKTNQNEA